MPLTAKPIVMLALLWLAFQPPLQTRAQCDETLTPSDNKQTKYTRRGNKCEGTLKVTVSSPKISLVNLTRGRVKYNAKDVIPLKSETPDEIYVRAVPISLSVYYRMDGTLSATQEIAWNVGDVLDPIGLRSENLGVFGWKGTEKDKTYIPIRGTDSQKAIHLILRTSVEVFNFQWRIAQVVQGKVGSFASYKEVGNFQPNRPIDIVLDENIKGSYIIEATSQMSGAPPLRAEFKIFVP